MCIVLVYPILTLILALKKSTLQKTESYSAHGKFLITGEYAVLDNVPALAVPLKLDQRLTIEPRQDGMISWKSYNNQNELWIDIQTNYRDLFELKGTHLQNPIAKRLAMVLHTAAELNPKFQFPNGFSAETHLDFNQYYGMGTSSTLVSLVSQWIGCDPFKLQFKCFGGSGYDVACARVTHPIIYQYNDGQPLVKQRYFDPLFEDELFFVYLNHKQNSRESIAQFDKSKLTASLREELSAMPDELITAGLDRIKFCSILDRHEEIISGLIGLEPVKKKLFQDFQGSVKSLGGWGGDFILAVGGREERAYFKKKGYRTIYNWKDIVYTGE